MQIETNDAEVAALRQLLHRAVLHSGMDVAEAALYWNKKLSEAQDAWQRNANAVHADAVPRKPTLATDTGK